ncbi:MAG: hypothetical protein KQH63_06925 [Desulfobulbaceae bacterium]|nr:hypothetical protein [Desulfobulbaceae bacterium]
MNNNKNVRAFGKTIKGICWLTVAMFSFLLSGCLAEHDLIDSSYHVADELISQLDPALIDDYPILTASFVNIDNLEKSSTLGRAIAEYVASRFVQKNFKVVELKLRNTVYIKEKSGEFLLSREIRDISTEHEVKALVVGTYSIAKNMVYVSARVVDPADATILATYDYSIPIRSNVSHMLSQY